MGKTTGFMEFRRTECKSKAPEQRVSDFSEFHNELPEKERRRQAGRCMDCGVPFCQAEMVFDGRRLGCPLNNLIPEWNDLLWRGNHEQALKRLLKTNCFPEFTGRVCPAPCEAACTCGMIGQSVTIRDNELSIIEYAFENELMSPKLPRVRSGKRVALVGSGPAGLSAAHWLNWRGHAVTVFERDQEIGGLLTYGIPNMKLPKEIVRRRRAFMEAQGITFVTGTEIGRDVTMTALSAEYDKIILCCGALKPRQLEYKGEAKGIYYALDYLKAATQSLLGEPCMPISAKGKKVVVVGAGDSASDCVATAIRQGCTSLVQLIRKPASAYTSPADYARQEAEAVFGQDIRRFESRVLEVIAGEDGSLEALVVADKDSEYRLEAQMLIIASGFSGCEDIAAALARDAAVPADKILIAGDMRYGATLVVSAIADGRRAAAQADKAMMGYTNIIE